MNKDFWEKVNKLEELAGKATQGGWKANTDDYGSLVALSPNSKEDISLVIEPIEKADADYIAAANPAMIKEMIAEIKCLQSIVLAYQGGCNTCGCVREKEITRLQKQVNDQKSRIGRKVQRIEILEKNLSRLREAYHRLVKEADWLADKLAWASEMLANTTDMEYGDLKKKGWRDVAKKAVSEEHNR